MKIKRHPFFLGSLIVLIGYGSCNSIVHAQDVSAIRNLYRNINSRIVKKQATKAIFVNKDSVWTEIDSAQIKSIDEAIRERAGVFLDKKELIKMVMDIQSPSGDWEVVSEYYFFHSGKTAFIFERLKTYQGYDYEHQRDLPPGPYIIEKRTYFDESGKEIRKLEKAFIESSGKSLKLEFLRDVNVDIYPDIQSLPFYSIMEKSSQ